MVTENLNQVRENIKAACEAAGRDPKEVTLIAVSKTKPVHMLQEAYDAGARVFGENKVQEITDKYPQLPKDIQWHMIGHLQRNKVKYIVDKVALWILSGWHRQLNRKLQSMMSAFRSFWKSMSHRRRRNLDLKQKKFFLWWNLSRSFRI